ncbi:Poly(A) RNA polymerase cid13 [Podospora conica]|nr:Poly(A) RNA polymerase cid13 [Schizothecium conicum]
MDGRPTAADSKHHYQPHPWPRATSGSSTPRVNTSSTGDSTPTYFTPALDIPLFLQQQTFHDKLLQYNQLISAGRGGGGLQTSPNPTGSSPHQKPPTRSRSSSKVSTKDHLHAKLGAQSCHGNRATKTSDVIDRASIAPATDSSVRMPHTTTMDLPTTGRVLPVRLPASNGVHAAAHSSSVPSTPSQHPRKFSCESREHSPGATQNHSPRSAYSETNGNVPSLRPLPPRTGGCRFEYGIPTSRRRIPYSIGSDRLEKLDDDAIKKSLSDEDEAKLEADMQRLYSQLLPTEEIETKRKKLVQKLETLLNKEWQRKDIRVHLFGSSGNLLCSDDSDVDICITTPGKEPVSVCMIAELLDKNGMEKVVCVSSAKVPIVKIWDPDLKLSCDMNVNNTPALENTRMVRTYVGIDDRVRPLAMIIKYWTRRRILNDAAFGGTLSSYTWICLIIAFLQLRKPPVLPALHTCDEEKSTREDGSKSEFGDDVKKLRARFGGKNKDSLAVLLFQFFRFYAHEFDYDSHVLSLRLGTLLTKTEKNWHIGTNNTLCIEEPFTVIRNLGNTADDFSFRGLHMELRRAFDLIADGKLEECCEQYVFPKEEERVHLPKPAVVSRPIMVRSSSQQNGGRGGRGFKNFPPRGGNGGRNGNTNGNSGRRGSGVAYDTNGSFPPTTANGGVAVLPTQYMWYPQSNSHMTPEMAAISAAYQEQHLRYQQLYHHMAFAQAQAQAQAQAVHRAQNGSTQKTDRSRTSSFDNPPLTAPLPYDFAYTYGMPIVPNHFHTGIMATSQTPTEYRRSLHRGAVASETAGSSGSGPLRSQSQPARTSMAAPQVVGGYATSSAQAFNGMHSIPGRQGGGVSGLGLVTDEPTDMTNGDGPIQVLTDSPPEDEGGPFIAYYVNTSSSPVRKVNGLSSAVPVLGELSNGAHGRRRLSTDQLPQTILDRRIKRTSRSPSPLGHSRAFSVGTNSAPLASAPFQTNGKLAPNQAPLVVSGSVSKPTPTPGSARYPAVHEFAVADDSNFDNPLHISQGQGFGTWSDPRAFYGTPVEPSPPPSLSDRPVIVNGSSTGRSPIPAAAYGAGAAGEVVSNGVSALPGARPRAISRQQQSGVAPLDLAGDFRLAPEHLSPVYENRTPSPAAARRLESSTVAQSPLAMSNKESRSEVPKAQQKPPTAPTKHEKAPALVSSDIKSANGHKESGHARGAKSQSDSVAAWQKPKTRKKGGGDAKALINGFDSGEQLPKDGADRKGG